MMKILIISSSSLLSNYGGGQIYLKNLIEELIVKSIPLTIAFPGIETESNDTYKNCSVLAFNRSLTEDEALDFLLEIKPDIIHIHGYKAIFSKVAKQLNIPCLITVHHGGILCPAGSLLNYRDEICKIKASPGDCLPCVLKTIRCGFYAWPFLRMITLDYRLKLGVIMSKIPFFLFFTPVLKTSLSIQEKANEWKTIYENCTLLIAPSKAIADIMILNQAPSHKITVIPHGIPILKDKIPFEVQERFKNKEHFARFIYLGRICYEKGIHIMLEAFNRINGNEELHIYGGAGNKNEDRYLKRLQKKYRQNSRIIWSGNVAYKLVTNILQQYDILIHPTICVEIFGLSIAEALSLGKQVIATRCGGAEMQIEEGVNGWLVEPNNTDALQIKIEQVITNWNKNKTKLLVKNSRITSISSHAERLISIYEKISNRH